MGLPDHLTWPDPIDPSGRAGPTVRQTRGGGWRRTSRGLYTPSSVDLTAEQRIVEAAAVLPRYGGVTGWAALRWLGGMWFDGIDQGGQRELPVTLALGGVRSIRSQAGITVSQERLDPTELTTHRGLVITTAVRSAFYEMRHCTSDVAAVQTADMAAYSDLLNGLELGGFLSETTGFTGMERARVGARDMDENSWSPMEVTMRRAWQHGAGLPRPLCNRPIFDLTGRHLVTPDLIDPLAGVAGEYNGAIHALDSQRARDVQRLAIFRDLQLPVVEMQAADLGDLTPFLMRLRDAYAQAQRRPVSDRSWTIEPPAWWVETVTVDQRRALDEGQRRRFLSLRLRAS